VKVIVTPREEHELSVFENRVMRKVFVPAKEGMEKNADPVSYNEEIRNLVFSTNIFTVADQGGLYGWDI
jgi:hypothetical protein